MDDIYLEIKIDEQEPFFAHANSVDKHIQFTKDGMIDRKLAFLDAGVSVKDGGTFGITVYRKPTHTNQYLLFDSYHPAPARSQTGGCADLVPQSQHCSHQPRRSGDRA